MPDVGVADVRATLQNTVDDGPRHHYFAYVETIVRDGRGLNMTLGAHSFTLKRRISDLF